MFTKQCVVLLFALFSIVHSKLAQSKRDLAICNEILHKSYEIKEGFPHTSYGSDVHRSSTLASFFDSKTIQNVDKICSSTQGLSPFTVLDDESPSNIIYFSCFDEYYKQPSWTLHVLSHDLQGSQKRQAPSAWDNPFDYQIGIPKGFENGHLVPSTDFNGNALWSRSTFNFINRAPQLLEHDGNWRRLVEEPLQEYVKENEIELIIVTVSLLKPSKDTQPIGNATVPAEWAKIVYDPETEELFVVSLEHMKNSQKIKFDVPKYESIEHVLKIFSKFDQLTNKDCDDEEKLISKIFSSVHTTTRSDDELSPDATPSSATPSSATSSDVTSSNATLSPNATVSNVIPSNITSANVNATSLKVASPPKVTNTNAKVEEEKEEEEENGHIESHEQEKAENGDEEEEDDEVEDEDDEDEEDEEDEGEKQEKDHDQEHEHSIKDENEEEEEEEEKEENHQEHNNSEKDETEETDEHEKSDEKAKPNSQPKKIEQTRVQNKPTTTSTKNSQSKPSAIKNSATSNSRLNPNTQNSNPGNEKSKTPNRVPQSKPSAPTGNKNTIDKRNPTANQGKGTTNANTRRK